MHLKLKRVYESYKCFTSFLSSARGGDIFLPTPKMQTDFAWVLQKKTRDPMHAG